MLAGEQTLDEIVLNPLSWYEENHIRLHLGKKVVEVDRRAASFADAGRGRHRPQEYDRLLIATGSNPFHPAGAGQGARRRDRLPRHRRHQRDDRRGSRSTQHAVVIGGGLLGLEAANGLMLRGMQVTVVHIMPLG